MFPLVQFAEQSRKEVMPTRQELELAGLDKRTIKDLEKHGYIKTETLILRENTQVCGRVVHYLTPKAIELLLTTGAIKEEAPLQIQQMETLEPSILEAATEVTTEQAPILEKLAATPDA